MTSTTRKHPFPGIVMAGIALVGVAMLAFCGLSVVSLAVGRSHHRSQTFAAVRQLNVRSTGGDIRIVAEARSDVRVDSVLHTTVWRPHVRTWMQDGKLTLRGRCSVTVSFSFDAHGCGVDFVVHVPLATQVTAHAAGGEIVASGLRAPLDLSTSAGDIRVVGASGPLEAGTGAGEIRVYGYRGQDAHLHTSAGDVRFDSTVPPRLLRATTSAGEVRLWVPNVAYAVSTHTGAGDSDVQVRQDPRSPRKIVARTSAGDIHVKTVSPDG